MNTEPILGPFCGTGIPGLDTILGGGLPRNCLYLVQGDSGVGKTTLALQFFIEGVRAGEKALYIALSETRDEILAVAQSHQWNLDMLEIFELSALEQQLAQTKHNTLFHPSELELSKTTKLLLDEIERVQPARLVFDSLSELRLLSESALRYRRQILGLKQFFAPRRCTALLLDDRAGLDASDLQVQSIAHGVITLEKRITDFGAPRRTLTVDKLRGLVFQEGSHDYVIQTGGVQVFPRLIAAEYHKEFVDEPISSGLVELDALLGGGLDRGTRTLILGPAGTGKSSIAFLRAAFRALHPEDRAAYQEAMAIGLAGDTPFVFQGRFSREDGAQRWIELLGQLTRDDAGAPLWMLGTTADITQRKLAEEASIGEGAG